MSHLQPLVAAFFPWSSFVGQCIDIIGVTILAREWRLAMAWEIDRETIKRAFEGAKRFREDGSPHLVESERIYINKATELWQKWAKRTKTSIDYPPDSYVIVRRKRWFWFGYAVIVLGFLLQAAGSWPRTAASSPPVATLAVPSTSK